MELWVALADASPLVIILTFIGLLVSGKIVLDRELKAIKAEREKSDARADRFEQMTLRLLATTEKVAAIAEKELP